MGIGVSMLLIAAGAILVWAVHVSTSGFNLHTIGWILLAVGAAGALLSLIFWSSWAVWEHRAARQGLSRRLLD